MSNLFVYAMVAVIMAVAQFVFPVRNRETKQAMAIRVGALIIALIFLILAFLELFKFKF